MPATHKHKVCAECGKSESDQWARHWKRRHPDQPKRELAPGEAPARPYDESWIYLIEPESLREQFLRAVQLLELPPNFSSTN